MPKQQFEDLTDYNKQCFNKIFGIKEVKQPDQNKTKITGDLKCQAQHSNK